MAARDPSPRATRPSASALPQGARSVGPGRPKDLGKRQAILDAAKAMFTRHGFAGVSMDQIAAEAGVSKLTVYSHFGDKEALFAAAVRAKCEEQLPPDLFAAPRRGSLRTQLLAIARGFFGLVMSEEAIAMHRMMLGSESDDKLRELFWQAGPQRVQDSFAEFLRPRVAAGDLLVPDVSRAASQFFCLLKGEPHARLMCGLSTGPTAAEARAHIAATVDLFLRAHAAARAP